MQKTAEITEGSLKWLTVQCFFSFSPQTLTLLNVPCPSCPSLLRPLNHHLQICVGKNDEIDGFLRLSSGKKRGLVPANYLLEIWWHGTSLTLSLTKFTKMEEYSGVFTQHLTDREPRTFTPLKSGEFAALFNNKPQLCFLLRKTLKVKKGGLLL